LYEYCGSNEYECKVGLSCIKMSNLWQTSYTCRECYYNDDCKKKGEGKPYCGRSGKCYS